MVAGNNTTSTFEVLLNNQNNFINLLKYFKYLYYIRLALVAIGIPGNIMCIYIMRRRTFKEMARSYICITLAFADIGYLLFEALRASFLYMTEWKESHVTISVVTCKLNDFLSFFLLHLDAWMIVFLSVERFVAVFW